MGILQDIAQAQSSLPTWAQHQVSERVNHGTNREALQLALTIRANLDMAARQSHPILRHLH